MVSKIQFHGKYDILKFHLCWQICRNRNVNIYNKRKFLVLTTVLNKSSIFLYENWYMGMMRRFMPEKFANERLKREGIPILSE